MRKQSLVLLVLGVTAANSCFAGLAALKKLQTNAGCGGLSSELIEEPAYDDPSRGYIGESLRVFFDSFVLTAEKAGRSERDCKLTAAIEVPAGYRFRPTLAAAEGFYNIQPKDQNKGGIKVSYVVQPSGQKAERENAKPFTDTGDILCKAELTDPRFTACYNRANTVSLDTDLRIWLDQSTDGSSVIQLDASRTKSSLKWNWQFQRCENFFDQKWFQTRYQAYDGKWYDARMFFDLDGGRFESSAGFVARLSAVQYSEDGREVQANWASDNASGWLKLHMSDVSSGSFNGEWGNSQGFKAPWTGSYAGSPTATSLWYSVAIRGTEALAGKLDQAADPASTAEINYSSLLEGKPFGTVPADQVEPYLHIFQSKSSEQDTRPYVYYATAEDVLRVVSTIDQPIRFDMLSEAIPLNQVTSWQEGSVRIQAKARASIAKYPDDYAHEAELSVFCGYLYPQHGVLGSRTFTIPEASNFDLNTVNLDLDIAGIDVRNCQEPLLVKLSIVAHSIEFKSLEWSVSK